MSPLLDTVFVLGAGFSVEQGFPLARDIRQDVISFLNSERNPQQGFLRPGNGGYPEGQFYAGLGMIEEDGELPFEELLIKLAERLKQGDAGPCRQTDEQLRIGARRVLWEIHNSIEQVEPAYKKLRCLAPRGLASPRHHLIQLGSSSRADVASGECAMALLPDRNRSAAGDQATRIDQLEQVPPGKSHFSLRVLAACR